jgi:hypothetical protein
VTGKAIQGDRYLHMASAAKVPLVLVSYWLTRVIGDSVAGDATVQAVLRIAQAMANRHLLLLEQQCLMLTPHVSAR